MERGFTLIELLIVIAIIGLLGTLTTVSFSSSKEKARLAAGQALSSSILRTVGDDAIGVWPFDECSGNVATDYSGQGHDGSFNGSPSWQTDSPTPQGCSLRFNGSSYITTTYNWVAQHNSFTVSAWFKTTSAGDQVIVSNGNTHAIKMNNGYIISCLATCGTGTKKVNDNKWHFVAVTGDSSSIRVYLDAGSKPEITMAASSAASVGQMDIGHCSFGGYEFNGRIDDVRIYQRSLASQDVHQLYAKSLQNIVAQIASR